MAKAMGGTFQRFIGHVVPGVIRPLRALWNQLIGFLFLVLAAGATPSAVRNVRQFNGDFESLMRAAIAVVFMVAMLYFGITSLLRARRITRS
jgi:ABC-type arginine transport system permease subunit